MVLPAGRSMCAPAARRLKRGPAAPHRSRPGTSLTRGTHKLRHVSAGRDPPWPASTSIRSAGAITAEKRALHYRLFGMEPGDSSARRPPQRPRAGDGRHSSPAPFAVQSTPPEIDRFLTLYDRAAQRGDPYEERMKLMLRAVLVSPGFPVPRGASRTHTGHPSAGPVRNSEPPLVFPLVHRRPMSSCRGSPRENRLQDPKCSSLKWTACSTIRAPARFARTVRRPMAGHAGSGRPRRAAPDRTAVLLHA